ncbi:hypothetical protein [Colwellia sp. RSH04]|uniref:hypothetical protein n=1 Tax=Colwellia sp. RSH04 TaxID=2305464 RepID=UPI000E58C722|nr:hypothetical protein [Colwellia sp. RSH04]RHW77762.1 hypothetical protein D1094_02175 [Colwellia sp. RSH04]
MKGFLKSSFKWLAILLVALPLSLYFILVIINLVDENKSPLVVAFEQKLEQISQVPDEDNAFIYFMGIEAPQGADVFDEGMKNIARLSKEPAHHSIDRKLLDISLLNEVHYKIISKCKAVNFAQDTCSKSLSSKKQEIDALLNGTKVLQQRFETMSSLNAWFEIIPENTTMGIMGDYTLLKRLFDLQMLKIWRNAPNTSTEQTLEQLKQEAQFRHKVLLSSRTLMASSITLHLYNDFLRWADIILADVIFTQGKTYHLATLFEPLPLNINFERIAIGEWQFGKAVTKQIIKGSVDHNNPFETILGFILQGLLNEQATYNLNAEILNIKWQQSIDKKALITMKRQCEFNFTNALLWYPYNLVGKMMLCPSIEEPIDYNAIRMLVVDESEALRNELIKKYAIKAKVNTP